MTIILKLETKMDIYRINDIWTFCNMTFIAAAIADGRIVLSCADVEGHWRKIADINVDAGDDCPNGWNKSSHSSFSFCRTPNNDSGCYSASFSANEMTYQNVCGRARAYQKGTPDAFYFHDSPIDSHYVEGLSITHGNPRQHIWTYACGTSERSNYTMSNCPCAVIPGPTPPSYVGSNYYCESGAEFSGNGNDYYFSDPLWDAAGCSINGNCCLNTDQPWFHRQLDNMIQDDIEVRICGDSDFTDDAILIDILELYIQ